MNVRRLLPRPAFALAAFAIGCGSSSPATPTAELSVSWQIGGSTCNKSGLATVEITVSDRSGPIDSQMASCQTGSYVFRALPEGLYRIDVEGFPADADRATYDGDIPELAVRAGGINAAPKISLAQKPGALDVRWRFDDGDLCHSHGINWVELSVWDAFNNIVVSELLPCDLSKLEAEPVAADPSAIPDPTAETFGAIKGYLVEGLGAGTYTVDVHGKADPNAATSFWDQSTAKVYQARSQEIPLFLKSCQEVPNANLCTP